jgi:hypothetical protein
MLRPRILLVCCLMIAAAPAVAQLVNENLLVAKPDGYKIGFNDKKNNAVISEMVPVSESVENWTEMVTVQIFLGMKGVTPEQFKARMEKLWSGACANAISLPVANVVENGYPVNVWHMTCPLNAQTGKTEITFFKAIQGNDSFYVVQKAFKFEPTKEQVVTWTTYLKKISVCDSRLPERRCPAAGR